MTTSPITDLLITDFLITRLELSPSVGPASKAGWRDGSLRGSILLALIFLLVTFLLIK